ncbi:ABC transporter permease subunit [Psychrobacillus sp. FSL H8-0510]|uniref:ABC transporter permease subunit n=1 Tax=Psychrobacillus sp. FSL H8-0510 TaxID=2921394 RepID=UPI0030FBC3FA
MIWDNVCRFICVVIGLILLSAFVGLFTNGLPLNLTSYIDIVLLIIKSLIFPQLLEFTGPTGFEYSIFTNFWNFYLYSAYIFLAALFFSMMIGIVVAYLTTLLPKKINLFTIKMASLLESLPDLFIIIVIQFSVLFYFKQTGIQLFSTIATAQNRSYLLPVVALTLIPALMIYKVVLFLVNEEMEKSYIQLARGIGFDKTQLFFTYVLRNITPSIVLQSKSVIIILLSSMVIFEKLFNINGIFTFIISYPEPEIIAFSLIMIYLPIFIVYTFLIESIYRKTGQRLEW